MIAAADLQLDMARVFEQMLTIRRFEERLLELHRDGVIFGSTHLANGQEAIAVGARSSLENVDSVVATYRGHHWALACGVEPSALFAELAGREQGTNGGRGGSAYLSAPEHGFVGENSIVGAGLPIADGLALAAAVRGEKRVTLVAFGDGATNQGAALEGLIFAVNRRLPIIFLCENNQWSEMTPIRAMVPVELSDRAQGFGMATATVDGTDVLAVAAAVEEAAERARAGEGPTFIECKTQRLVGHYQDDIEHYRPQSERLLASDADPIARVRSLLDEQVAERIDAEVNAVLLDAERQALADTPADVRTVRDHVYSTISSARRRRVSNVGSTMTYLQAINAALQAELRARPDALLYGEDVAIPGGVFGATKNLLNEFGADRVFDTPISEAAILGSAVGAAIAGMRPIVEVMFGDFLLVALDQIVNQAANVSYLSRGQVSCPIVVRTQHGATPGSCAQHSQCLEAFLAHIPGIRVGVPATADDAYEMTRAAVACDDPVVLYESRALYTTSGLVDVDGTTGEIGGGRLVRDGADLTIVSWGRMVAAAAAAAETLVEDGVQASVIDLRWLNPLDEDLLFETVKRTSRLLVVHEANLTGGFGAEVVARAASACFFDLDAPPARLALPDVRMPAAPALQTALLPKVEDVVEAARQLMRN
jgi:2-oxoisovalerate dehydrogenase E1 component